MIGWIETQHPVTGETIKAVPTGKVQDRKAEVKVITPGARIYTLWITRTEIVTPTPPLDTI